MPKTLLFIMTLAFPRIDKELDARHLRCPLPLLKAKQALQVMQAGQVLRVLATDPGSVRDFAAWCGQVGHDLHASTETDHTFVYLVKKQMAEKQQAEMQQLLKQGA